MQETEVWCLGREDTLEKRIATHSSIFGWGIPWTEKSLVDYSPRGHKESDTTEQSSTAQTRPYALLNEVLKANGVNNVN